MAELRTDFKDDILAEAMGGRRRYQMIQNEDGTVSFVDVTEYEQVGSEFGQAEINATNAAVIALQNERVETADPMTATEEGLAADAKLTGEALRDLSAKMLVLVSFDAESGTLTTKSADYQETPEVPEEEQ